MHCRLRCWRSSVSRTSRTQFSGPRWSISSIAALAHAGADGERSGAGCRARMQSLRPSKLGCMIAKQLLDLVGPFVVTVLLYVLTCSLCLQVRCQEEQPSHSYGIGDEGEHLVGWLDASMHRSLTHCVSITRSAEGPPKIKGTSLRRRRQARYVLYVNYSYCKCMKFGIVYCSI